MEEVVSAAEAQPESLNRVGRLVSGALPCKKARDCRSQWCNISFGLQ